MWKMKGCVSSLLGTSLHGRLFELGLNCLDVRGLVVGTNTF